MTSTNVHPIYELILWTRDTVKQLDAETIQDYITHFPQYYYAWWIKLLEENPYHIVIETGLLMFIIWLMFIRRTIDPKKETKTKLTQKEIDWLVDTWKPEPLVPDGGESPNVPVVEKVLGNHVKVRGVKENVLNLASCDFLGLGQLGDLKDTAKAALDKYGCGSCGPRGFYGTIDVHLDLEKRLAEFLGTEQAICYSDGASAVSSCIPAYSKRGDLILVDEGCAEPIRTGVNLSRSTVHYFKHNDMQDLANLLETVAKDDKKYKRDATQQRRFIVTEGLYHLTGDLCPLPELLKLRNKYCYRLIVDETMSFGTLGATGRGLTEHFGVNIADVDIITLAMDTTLAGIGGACVGTREVVDHQRLSGSGYCFSASAPPFLFAASLEALNHLDSHGSDLLVKLRANVAAIRTGVDSIPHIEVISDEESAVVQLAMIESSGYEDDQDYFHDIADFCLKHGVAVVASGFDEKLTADMKKNNSSLQATLRLHVSAGLGPNEIKKVLKELKTGVVNVMGK